MPNQNSIDTFFDFIAYYKQKFDMNEICKYHMDKINDSFFNKGVYEEIDFVKNEIDVNMKRYEILSKKLSDLVEKGSSFVKLDKTEKDGYFLNITEKRSKILKSKFVKTKHSIIKIDDTFSIDPKKT